MARNSRGRRAPVDLSLKSAGDQAEVTVNSPAPTEFDTDLPAAELTDSGARIAMEGAVDHGSVVTDDRTFFPNSYKDTDAVFAPDPTGFEFSLILRSPDSPESFPISTDGVPGSAFAQTIDPSPIPNDPPRSFELRDGSGDVQAFVRPPTVYDAIGQPVESKLVLKPNGDLALEVHHRADGRLVYPLLADPLVQQDYSTGGLTGATSCAWDTWGGGWQWTQNLAGGSSGFGFAQSNARYFCGIYQSMPSNSSFINGAYGMYYYRAKPGTYVYRVIFGNSSHTNEYCPYENALCSRAFSGIANSAFSQWTSSITWQAGANPYAWTNSYANYSFDYCRRIGSACAVNARTSDYTNLAATGIQALAARYGWEYTPSGADTVPRVTMSWASVFLGDDVNPTFSSPAPGNRDWFDDNGGSASFAATVADAGLGVKSLTVHSEYGDVPLVIGCSGNADTGKCPSSSAFGVGYWRKAGINNLSIQGKDLADNTVTQSWQEKVDRDPPVYNGATLYDTTTGQPVDLGKDALTGSSYRVNVNASDPTSGVSSIKVYVDEVYRATLPASNPSWTFNPDSLSGGDGIRHIRFEVADGVPNDARHIAKGLVDVVVDRRGDIYHARASEGDPAVGAAYLNEEWAQPSTGRARETGPDGYGTQNVVNCAQNGAGCMEVRRYSQDQNAFATLRGSSPYDSGLAFSDLLGFDHEDTGALQAAGPIRDELQSWQTPPPDYGPQYEVYDQTENAAVDGKDTTLTTRFIVDSKHHLPLRRTELEGTSVEEDQWYSYDRVRLEDSEVGPSFFSPLPPAGASAATYVYGSPPASPPPPALSPTVDELVAQSLAFDTQQGFTATDSLLRALIADPTRQEAIDRFGAALTVDQGDELDLRLAAQDAMPVIDSFAATRQATYAGVYMDNPGGGLLYVGFTADAQNQVDQLKASFPYPARLRAFTAARSMTDLQAMQARLESDWGTNALPIANVSAVGIDERLNLVVVGSINPGPQDESLLQGRYGSGVILKKEDPQTAAGRHLRVTGGELIRPDVDAEEGIISCTLGFGTYRNRSGGNNTTVKQYDNLTAGHCIPGARDGGVNASIFKPVEDRDYRKIGHIEGQTLRPGGGKVDADAATINLKQRLHSAYVLSRTDNKKRYLRVGGIGLLPHPGWTICQMGSTTGHTICGSLIQASASVTVRAGPTGAADPPQSRNIVHPVYKIQFPGDCPIRAGDSGGPVWGKKLQNGGIGALGIVSAFDGDEACATFDDLGFEHYYGGNVGYASHVSEAMQHFDQSITIRKNARP